jgi:hypothetical protein
MLAKVHGRVSGLAQAMRNSDDALPIAVYFHYPNHNISSDTLAAVQVFASELTISVINDAVTNKLWWQGLALLLLLLVCISRSEPAGEPSFTLMKATYPPECKVVSKLLNVSLPHIRTLLLLSSSPSHGFRCGTCTGAAYSTEIFAGRVLTTR